MAEDSPESMPAAGEAGSASSPHVVRADQMSGADAGLKIIAAIAQLLTQSGGAGGVVDATYFPNPQNLTGFTVPPGVTVVTPPILFTMFAAGPSIVVNQGGHLHTMGRNSPGATTIKPANGFNKDVIRCMSTAGASNWWHHASVKNIRVDGNKAGNSTGHGIAVYNMGETSTVSEANIFNCAQAGLYIQGSQAGTNSIDNVTTNACGVAGIQLHQFTSGLTLKCVGGDENPVTVLITNPQQGGGAIMFLDLKSEGAKDKVIKVTGGNSTVNLTLVGGNFSSPAGAHTMIQIAANVGAPPVLNIVGLVAANYFTVLIDDQKTPFTVPCTPLNYIGMLHYCAGKYVKFDPNGFVKFPA